MAKPPVSIAHPRGIVNHGRFVASGVADPRFQFVMGRLTALETQEAYLGRTIFHSPKWGIHFGLPHSIPPGHYMLEVTGVSIDSQSGTLTSYRARQELHVRELLGGVVISWPGNDDTVCIDNFVPYGTYS